MCEQKQKEGLEEIDPIQVFREEVRRCWRGDIKGPFNVEDREKAGMSRDFYENLKGEMPYTALDTVATGEEHKLVRVDGTGIAREASPDVRAEYEH